MCQNFRASAAGICDKNSNRHYGYCFAPHRHVIIKRSMVSLDAVSHFLMFYVEITKTDSKLLAISLVLDYLDSSYMVISIPPWKCIINDYRLFSKLLEQKRFLKLRYNGRRFSCNTETSFMSLKNLRHGGPSQIAGTVFCRFHDCQ